MLPLLLLLLTMVANVFSLQHQALVWEHSSLAMSVFQSSGLDVCGSVNSFLGASSCTACLSMCPDLRATYDAACSTHQPAACTQLQTLIDSACSGDCDACMTLKGAFDAECSSNSSSSSTSVTVDQPFGGVGGDTTTTELQAVTPGKVCQTNANASGNDAAPNNFVTDAGTGGHGGSCTCPNGEVYQVGDNGDNCATLACINGVSGTCNAEGGDWSGNKVTCDEFKWQQADCVNLALHRPATQSSVDGASSASRAVDGTLNDEPGNHCRQVLPRQLVLGMPSDCVCSSATRTPA